MKAIRRPIFWFGLAMWVVSFALATLLVQLGAQVMSDVPTAGRQISQSEFIDADAMAGLEGKIKGLQRALDANAQAQEDARFRLQSRTLDYDTQRTGFENWLKTRTATQSEDQNPEVTRRVKALEQLKAAQRDAQAAVNDLVEEKANLDRSLQALRQEGRSLRQAAAVPYQSALKVEVLKVFLIRLALTLPLLLVSVWLIARKRQSAYWPLYRSFIMFSLFAFFVELVPYLPSYGGYVRIAVGIVLVCAAGHYAIKYMARYLSRKKQEEAQPEAEKRKAIPYEAAIKKITQGVCPSCDRQFQLAAGKKSDAAQPPKIDFCVHCGFSLFRKCGSCGERENSFFKFCGSCGVPSTSAQPGQG